MNGDAGYLIRRMMESREAAHRASHPAAREVHLKLAALYQAKAQVRGGVEDPQRLDQYLARTPLKPKFGQFEIE